MTKLWVTIRSTETQRIVVEGTDYDDARLKIDDVVPDGWEPIVVRTSDPDAGSEG